ncbi:hypothetical protein PM082_010388 [Marasmius tenuissimus]|nr:hypothetical protein PM082_010388 [Marasmius tenuissimus]
MSLPFGINLSYIILTPRLVKLPGQTQSHKAEPGSPPASPRKQRAGTSPGRWLGRLVNPLRNRSRYIRKSETSSGSNGNHNNAPLLEHQEAQERHSAGYMSSRNDSYVDVETEMNSEDEIGSDATVIGTAL